MSPEGRRPTALTKPLSTPDGVGDYGWLGQSMRFHARVERPPLAVILLAFSATPETAMKPSAEGVMTPETTAVFRPSIEAVPWSGVSIAEICVETEVVAAVGYEDTA